MTETKRMIAAEDVLAVQNVGDVQISPDGLNVVFVRTRTDTDKNKYQSDLWRVPTDGSRSASQLTRSQGSDTLPRWSPDGAHIAFVSDRADETAQVFLIAVGGGEAVALTTLEPGGIQSLFWSPDGTKIAFLYRATPAAYTKKAAEERKEKTCRRRLVSIRSCSIAWTHSATLTANTGKSQLLTQQRAKWIY